jgi:hypothetical protein
MKVEIAHMTLFLLTVVAALFVLGIVVLVLCAGLRLNPFRERTTSFLLAVFGGLIGLASILVLLNIATNISLIADAKIAGANVLPDANVLTRWIPSFLGTALAVVSVIFAATHFSRKKFLQIVRAQADDVLKRNEGLVKEISSRLAASQPSDYKRVWEIREFLKNQRSDLPDLAVIYSGKFADKLALYQIETYYSGNEEKNTYTPKYFACTQNLDCEYLTEFFSGTKVDVLQNCTSGNDFCIYIPIVGSESRFVLLFERKSYYGKFGS